MIVENYLQSLNPNEDKLFGLSFRNTTEGLGTSLNCWRGYQAIYEVENDSLFVKHIITCFELKDNKKFMLKCLKLDAKSYQYASDRLKEDDDIRAFKPYR